MSYYDNKYEMRRTRQRSRRRKQRQRIGITAALCILIICVIVIGLIVHRGGNNDDKASTQAASAEVETEKEIDIDESVDAEEQDEPEDSAPKYQAHTTQDTTQVLPSEVISTYAIIIDRNTDSIIAGNNYNERISPASMTKILTVLVAAEHVENMDDTCTITRETTDYCYVNGCSAVGFDVDETVTVKDLFYGTILPSGADAAVTLAEYVAGSHDEFVVMMNEKLEELGLSDTSHFTNCVGLYDENHYSTVYDIAMILEAAMDNEFCREVLSAHVYTITTDKHPDGITVSNWFLRRIEDHECGGEVLGAKTGFVTQSGNCAASCAKDKDGNEYICVTGNSTSTWNCIYDHVYIYKQFLPQ